jgi:hypothetical protein
MLLCGTGSVKKEGQVLLKKSKVCVCSENGHFMARRYGADEKVGV